MLVSVIIPLYNAENTIAETIRSVLTQSYQNLEVIVVDDCSTDNSRAIAEQITAEDPRVKIISKTRNEGLNLARATGFGQATGEFVTFIDSDDAFTKDAITTLVGAQSQTGADIAMGGYLLCDENLTPLAPQPFPWQTHQGLTVYGHDEMLEAFLVGWAAWPHNNNPTIACCKLFRRSLLAQVDWNLSNYRVGEDDFFSLLTFNLAQKSVVTNQVIYNVRVTETSLSRQPNRNFSYQGAPITALELCQNFSRLAAQLLPQQLAPAIASRLFAFCTFYGDAPGMENAKQSLITPLVSIVVPVYNGAHTIGQTIESLLSQTYPHLEIIVVNDCSTDGTAEVIGSYLSQDDRVKVIHQPLNQGAAMARAAGFEHSTGQLIAFIDGDDIYLPNAIETLLEVYLRTGADISMGGYLACNKDLVPGLPLPFELRDNSGVSIYSHDQMLELFLLGFPAWRHNNNPTTAHCKLFIRRALEYIDWQATNYRLAEDIFFSLLTFAAARRSAATNEIIMHYRYHDGGKSREANRIYRYQGQVITAGQFCLNFAELAAATLPAKFTNDIAERYRQLYSYYQVDQPNLASNLAEIVVKQNQRIAELESAFADQQLELNQIRQSNTWKLGLLAGTPVRLARQVHRSLNK